MIIGMRRSGRGSRGRVRRRCNRSERRRGGGADEEDVRGADGRRWRAVECIALGLQRDLLEKGARLPYFRTSVPGRCGWSAGEDAKDRGDRGSS